MRFGTFICELSCSLTNNIFSGCTHPTVRLRCHNPHSFSPERATGELHPAQTPTSNTAQHMPYTWYLEISVHPPMSVYVSKRLQQITGVLSSSRFGDFSTKSPNPVKQVASVQHFGELSKPLKATRSSSKRGTARSSKRSTPFSSSRQTTQSVHRRYAPRSAPQILPKSQPTLRSLGAD